ncbi:MAG: hypothetical protein ACPG8N_10540 [Rhodothermales bacterium]
MRRSLFSLILLSSFVLGGLLGPVAHLSWMRFGMDPSGHHDSPTSSVTSHAQHPATSEVSIRPGPPCPEECLFLVLLASQASGISTNTEAIPGPSVTPNVFSAPLNKVSSAVVRSSSARDPPAIA